MALSIWTPSGIVDVGNGGPAYSAGNSLKTSPAAINTGSYNSSNTSLFSPSTPSVVSIPDQVIGGGSKFGPSEAWTPGAGNPPVTVSPTNVMGPFDYMQPSGPTAGGRGGRGNVGANKEYRDFMADRNASVNRTPNTGPTTSPTGGGSRAQSAGPAPIPEVLISQDLSQRTPSGSVYAPDLSAYNDSSLFNYTGPGGVDEYTYGQGLRTGGADYSIFGSPTDMANPYYEGQFAPLPASPADSAITMPAVQLPGGLPQIENNTPIAAIGGGSGTTQISPTQVGSVSSEANPGLTEAMAGSDEEYQEMLTASLNMDNQLMNQLDSSDPRGGENELNKDAVKVTGGMDDTADIERGMVTSQRGTTMDDTAAIEQGMRESQRGTTMDDTTAIQMGMMQGTPNPQSGLPVTQFGDVPQKTLTPLQQAARDASSNIDTRDFRFNPTGEQDKSLLQKWVESGPAYQPTSDSTIAEMEAMGNQVKSFADKTSQMRNLFDESVINTVGSPNQFEIQRAEADANQAALDKQRYNTQVNNPTADFSGYMRNYGDGGGFKEPAPVNVNFDSSLDPSNQASNYPPTIFTGSPSAGIDANTAQEIAARTEAMNAPDGNELMLEAIGLGNVFTGSKVSSPEKKKAEAEIVSIFAGGPSRKSVKSEPVVVKSTPKVKVNYNKNKPVAVKKTKPTPRGPQPVKVKRTTGSRGRGGYSRPASRSPSRSVGYSAYRRGNR